MFTTWGASDTQQTAGPVVPDASTTDSRMCGSLPAECPAETGLDYFGARYYGPAQGRFQSPDEAFADQDPADPQSWNLYGYVRNNPLRFIDPTGHECYTADDGTVKDNGHGGIPCYTVDVTAKAPAPPDLSFFTEMFLRSLVTTAQVAQQTQQLVQPAIEWLSTPRNLPCLAGAVGAGAATGAMAGAAGLATGPGVVLTVPGGFLGGGLLGGAAGMTACMSNGGPTSGGDLGGSSSGGAQAKKLSLNEIRKLEASTGESAHQIKTEALGTNKNIAQYDLYKDSQGNVFVKAKGGVGEAIPTGLKIR